MRKTLALALIVAALPLTAEAQSARGAFFRSLVLPGWGHHYANGGAWGTTGSLFATADVGMVLGAGSAEWRRGAAVESYRTLAAGGAGADLNGKNRTFFLRLATYRSSEEFLEVSLRNRAWDDIDYVADPSFQWNWQEERDYLEYRELREESETLRRRRTVLVASLVANRLVSGLSAARRAGRAGRSAMAFAVAPNGAYVAVRF
ncbi:MAG: hypothetical protein JJ896_11970 [Rhodothermales bacterium]|nr:hypothetical protein [Rhodothermales bacterium]MBO6780360.1 hypothetical protein [Rhodothermales bacterium]